MRNFIFFCASFLVACAPENTDLSAFEADTGALERRLQSEMIVSASAVTPSGDIMLEGSSMEHVGTLAFEAVNEPLELQRFKLKQSGSSAAVSAVHIEYLNEIGDVVSVSGTLIGGEIIFTAQELYVPVGATAELDIYVDVGNVVPGETIQFAWTDAGARAVGLDTSAVYGHRRMTNSVTLESFETHVTKPTVTLSVLSPSGGNVPGYSEVLRFNVAASSGGDVGVEELVFQLSSTDNSGSGWNTCELIGDIDLYNLTIDGTSVALDGEWELYGADGFPCSAGEVVSYVVFTGADLVPASMSYTFAVHADTMGASAATDDAIRLDIVDMLWTDAHYIDVFDGEFVNNLPLIGGTIFY